MAWEKEVQEVRERGGEMPSTALPYYVYEWVDNENLTQLQNEKLHEWWVSEINNTLPDYAEWVENTSEILLPIDKVDDFHDNVEWDDVLQKVYEKFLENELDILEKVGYLEKVEEPKMKVTMETAKDLWEKRHVGGTYSPVSYEGHEYVQIEDMDTPSYNATYQEAYWEGFAIRIGDTIDDDGYAPLYSLIWFLDNKDADDTEYTVDDWTSPSEIKENGEIDTKTGNIY